MFRLIVWLVAATVFAIIVLTILVASAVFCILLVQAKVPLVKFSSSRIAIFMSLAWSTVFVCGIVLASVCIHLAFYQSSGLNLASWFGYLPAIFFVQTACTLFVVNRIANAGRGAHSLATPICCVIASSFLPIAKFLVVSSTVDTSAWDVELLTQLIASVATDYLDIVRAPIALAQVLLNGVNSAIVRLMAFVSSAGGNLFILMTLLPKIYWIVAVVTWPLYRLVTWKSYGSVPVRGRFQQGTATYVGDRILTMQIGAATALIWLLGYASVRAYQFHMHAFSFVFLLGLYVYLADRLLRARKNKFIVRNVRKEIRREARSVLQLLVTLLLMGTIPVLIYLRFRRII